MKKNNVVQEKSFAFAARTINLYKYLTKDKKEFILSKKLLRAGTSVGANIEEALGGQSGNDFIAKMSISYKEIRESIYWLKLLQTTGFLSEKQFQSIYDDAEEIKKILTKILVTSKERINN